MRKDTCLLCQIIDGTIPSHLIYEDDLCIAILDVNGAMLGHTFVIPKNHSPIMEQVPDQELSHLFTVANKISSALFEKLRVIQGTNIYVSNGVPAGQRVAHFMIHVIPRMDKDGINLQWQPKQVPDEEMATVELKLKEQLKNTAVAKITQNVQEEPARPSFDSDDEDDYFTRQMQRIPRG